MIAKSKTDLEAENRSLKNLLERERAHRFRWEVRDDFVRDTKTGSVFYQADACSECYMPRIIMYPGDGDKPEILEHCACRMLVADDE